MNKTPTLPAAALLLAVLALPAQAADAAAPADAPAADALRVVVDPDTGKLRAPTAAEIKASDDRAAAARARAAANQGAAARAATAAAATPLVKTYANGARRARLTDAFHSHSVAVVRADGTLDTQCYEDHQHAMKALEAARAERPAANAKLETE